MPQYRIVFDDVIKKQLKKAIKNKHIAKILSDLFDRIEEKGPNAGELLDSKLSLYEIKIMHPPIRLYYKYNALTNELTIFQYEMKTSQEKQQNLINKLKNKILRMLNSYIFSSIFFAFSNVLFCF